MNSTETKPIPEKPKPMTEEQHNEAVINMLTKRIQQNEIERNIINSQLSKYIVMSKACQTQLKSIKDEMDKFHSDLAAEKKKRKELRKNRR